MDEVFISTAPGWGDEVERNGADVTYESSRVQVPAGADPRDHEYVAVWAERHDEDWRPEGPYLTLKDTDVRLFIDAAMFGHAMILMSPDQAERVARNLVKAAECARNDLAEQDQLTEQPCPHCPYRSEVDLRRPAGAAREGCCLAARPSQKRAG